MTPPAATPPTGSGRPAAGPGPPLAKRIGKYEILQRLGWGGMAEILLARASSLSGFEKIVVIKRIRPEFAQQREFVDMFLDEARIAATMHHPNLVQTFDVGEELGDYYMTMEYLHGENLSVIMKTLVGQQQRLPLEHVLNIGIGVCAGLQSAHEKTGADGRPLNVIHRDVTPQNVVVTYEGGVKLLDFGIAKAASRAAGTKTGALKGKVWYMSPEQCKGEELDHRSDLYSLGITLYEISLGRRMYRGMGDFEIMREIVQGRIQPPSTIDRQYPRGLERVLMKALTKDRHKRFQNAREMLAALEDLVRDSGIYIGPSELQKFMLATFGRKVEDWKAAEKEGKSLGEHLATQELDTLLESSEGSSEKRADDAELSEGSGFVSAIDESPDEMLDESDVEMLDDGDDGDDEEKRGDDDDEDSQPNGATVTDGEGLYEPMAAESTIIESAPETEADDTSEMPPAAPRGEDPLDVEPTRARSASSVASRMAAAARRGKAPGARTPETSAPSLAVLPVEPRPRPAPRPERPRAVERPPPEERPLEAEPTRLTEPPAPLEAVPTRLTETRAAAPLSAIPTRLSGPLPVALAAPVGPVPAAPSRPSLAMPALQARALVAAAQQSMRAAPGTPGFSSEEATRNSRSPSLHEFEPEPTRRSPTLLGLGGPPSATPLGPPSLPGMSLPPIGPSDTTGSSSLPGAPQSAGGAPRSTLGPLHYALIAVAAVALGGIGMLLWRDGAPGSGAGGAAAQPVGINDDPGAPGVAGALSSDDEVPRGTLVLLSKTRSHITIDGVDRGRAPLTLKVPAGRHSVLVGGDSPELPRRLAVTVPVGEVVVKDLDTGGAAP